MTESRPDDLAEAERKVRVFLVRHGDDNMELVMAEYDARARELDQVHDRLESTEAELDRLKAENMELRAQREIWRTAEW